MEPAIQKKQTLLHLFALFLSMGFATWAVMVWLGAQGHLIYIWPLTAIPLGFALPRWRVPRERYLQLAAIGLSEFIACEIVRLPLWISLVTSLVQTAEIWAAGTILSKTITTFEDLKSRRNIARLCITALLVPAVFLTVGAIPGSVLTHHSLWVAWRAIMPSDALGIVVILPLLLFFTSGQYRSIRKLLPHLVKALPALVLFLAATVAVFDQTTNPYLFIVFPPLALAVFLLGLEGSVFTLPALTIIACIATANHQGPLWIRPEWSPEHRLFVLQAFLAMAASVSLPIGALLDEKKRAEKAASNAQSIYQTLIQNSEDMIILSSLDGSRRFVSPAVFKMLGWTQDEFLALRFLDAVHPEDRDLAQTILGSLARGKSTHTFRYRAVSKDLTPKWVEASVSAYNDTATGACLGYVATVRDISSQKLSEQSQMEEKKSLEQENVFLANLAARDELTSIPNRRAFNIALNREAARHSRSDSPTSMLMIDVDYFKKYNDRYGHPEGDACLQQIARSLVSTIGRGSDLVARIGGEEFGVLLPFTDQAGAIAVAETILTAIRKLQIEHADSPLGCITVSAGISIWLPGVESEPALLIQQADRALYDSKRAGRNSISVYQNSAASTANNPSFSKHPTTH